MVLDHYLSTDDNENNSNTDIDNILEDLFFDVEETSSNETVSDDNIKSESKDNPTAASSTLSDENVAANVEDEVGITAFMNKSMQSYRKLPMLDVIFDKFARSLSSVMRNFTSEIVDIDVKNIKYTRFAQYVSSLQNQLIGVFRVIELQNNGLILIDKNSIALFVDVLLGGKKYKTSNTVPKKEMQNADVEKDKEKSITHLEQSISKRIIELMLSELSVAFSSIAQATFNLERIEQDITFSRVARSGDAVIVLKLEIKMMGSVGTIDVLIPKDTLEPIKQRLSQIFVGETTGEDMVWKNRFKDQIDKIEIGLEAVIIDNNVKLCEVLNFQVGNTIIIDHKATDQIVLRCEDIELFGCKFGAVNGKIAVNLTENLVKEIN